MDAGIDNFIAWVVSVAGGIGLTILWYVQVRQGALEIESLKAALKDTSEEKNKLIEENNILIEEKEESIKIIGPNDGTVVELKQRNRKYYFNVEALDRNNASSVFDVEYFEALEDLEHAEDINNYVDEVKDYADEVKKTLSEYPSNKYL